MVVKDFTIAAAQKPKAVAGFEPVEQYYYDNNSIASAAEFQEQRKGYQKIALFIGQDVTSLVMANELIPKLRRLNFEPIVFSVTPNNSPKTEAQHPQLHLLRDFQNFPISDVIEPQMKSEHAVKLYQEKPEQFDVVPLSLFHQVHKITPYIIPPMGIREPELVNFIQNDEKIVGGISIRPYQLFKQPLIDAFNEKKFTRKIGDNDTLDIDGFILNVHPGPLPQMRGIYTPLHAMAEFKTNYAWTIHHISEGIDEGDIVNRITDRIDYNHHALSLYTDFTSKAINTLEQEIGHLINTGQFSQKKSQNKIDATSSYYSYAEVVNIFPEWSDITDRLVEYNQEQEPSDRLTFDEDGADCVMCDPLQMAQFYADSFAAGDETLHKKIQDKTYGSLLKCVQDVAAHSVYTPDDPQAQPS